MILDVPRFLIDQLPLPSPSNNKISKHLLGYSVLSTAPINIEDKEWSIGQELDSIKLAKTHANNQEQLLELVKHLLDSNQPEITISIHGYSMRWKDVQDRNEKIYNLIEDEINHNKVFIGYRWQAENPSGSEPPQYYTKGHNSKHYDAQTTKFCDNLRNTLNSLPAFLLGLLAFSFQLLLLSVFLYFVPLEQKLIIPQKNLLAFVPTLLLLISYLYLKIFYEIQDDANEIVIKCNNHKNQPSQLKYQRLPILIILVLSIVSFLIDPILCLLLLIPFGATECFVFITESKAIYRLFPILMSLSINAFFLTYCVFPRKILSIIYFVLAFSVILVIVSLSLLRLLNYFRDRYRANNYGVLDLVELLRQLDILIYKQQKLRIFRDIYSNTSPISSKIDNLISMSHNNEIFHSEYQKLNDSIKKDLDNKDKINQRVSSRKRVRINFIGHSMGCFVVTNTIRILSDVFDDSAIQREPDSDIGKSLKLGRMVLVAPDIPVESISSSISNYLASSLRRCSEAYVFSSEADVVVRFASTAANFISYPASKRLGGYRLGNITINNFGKNGKKYGIANFDNDKSLSSQLEIRASESAIQPLDTLSISSESVADGFTYFDCTDYKDIRYKPDKNSGQPVSLLSYGLGKRALSFAVFSDYFWLSVSQFACPKLRNIIKILIYPIYWMYYYLSQLAKNPQKEANFLIRPRKLNTHGGYFEGDFSLRLICGLAFYGFDEYLNKLNRNKQISSIEEFHLELKKRKIQVLISKNLRDLYFKKFWARLLFNNHEYFDS